MNNSPEKTTPTPETESVSHEALERLRHERQEQLNEDRERASSQESSPEDIKDIHKEALEHAASTSEQLPQEASPVERRNRGPISRKERDVSFAATMNEVRQHMSAPSRTFSQVIHNKAVEKTSEVVGGTIARPNAILAGAIAAFAFTLAVYLIAKNYGYPLSGFESIGAFAIGWVLGLMYDFLKIMITGRK